MRPFSFPFPCAKMTRKKNDAERTSVLELTFISFFFMTFYFFRYDPERITYYPDDVVDVITTAHTSSPSANQPSGSDGTVSLSTLPLSSHSSSAPQTLVRIPQNTPNQILAQSMDALSLIASDITHIQHRLEHSADQQSAYHRQLL